MNSVGFHLLNCADIKDLEDSSTVSFGKDGKVRRYWCKVCTNMFSLSSLCTANDTQTSKTRITLWSFIVIMETRRSS